MTDHDEKVTTTHRPRSTSFRGLLRVWLWLLFVLVSVWLTVLAVTLRPLPGLAFGEASLVTILFALFSIAANLWHTRNAFAFGNVFLAITFLFTCSSLVLYQYIGHGAFLWWRFMDLETATRGLPLVMLAFAAFCTGSLWPLARGVPKHRTVTETEPDPYESTLRWLSYALYAISIAVVMYYTAGGQALALAAEQGYQGFAETRKAGGMSALIVASLNFFLPWSLLILVAGIRKRSEFVKVGLLAVPALGVMFLSGDRTAPLTVLVLMTTAAVIKNLPDVRIGKGKSIAIVALALFLIPAIRAARDVPLKDWRPQTLVVAIRDLTRSSGNLGIAGAVLMSGSSAYQTMVGTLKLVPDAEPHRYGLDYLRSVGVAIPFGGRLAGVDLNATDSRPTQWITERFHPGGMAGLGYLQLAEAYLQFGVLGVVLLYVALGRWMASYWRRLMVRPISTSQLAYTLIAFMALYTWVRNDATGVARFLVWGWLIVYLIPRILHGRFPLRWREA